MKIGFSIHNKDAMVIFSIICVMDACDVFNNIPIYDTYENYCKAFLAKYLTKLHKEKQ